ncbi:MAG TPA: zinc-dependent metalloprotease [Tepidisphaeraceae bacterium]|jgi:hypothetical protein
MIRPAAVALAALAVALPVFAQTSRPIGALPPFEDVTRDMDVQPGLMTFYRYKAADVTKDQTRLLCAVPRSLLKQDLLFAVNFSRGNMAGFQYVDGLVRWEQVGRQLTLVAPDTRFVDKPGSPINEAVRRTYRPSYVFAVPIVTTTPNGDPVVDLSDALFSPGGVVPFPGGGRVRRDISRIDSTKSFADNTLIDVDYAIAGVSGGSTVGLSYAFRRLPSLSEGYQPRPADERVGYFQTTRQDWTTKYDRREFVDRFVNRWSLKKKDPTLDLSPPEKPITFVIEKGVPYQWRRYVADGILEWNKAFEKCGIVGAVVVQQQTEDNEFADVDPADARYNFIQWTVRNQALAVGPSRADPRTGQILDADIVIDDAWIRVYNQNAETFSPKAVASLLGPGTVAFLEKHPEFLPPGVTAEQLKNEAGADLMQDATASADAPQTPLRYARGRDQCELAGGLVQQLAIAQGVIAQAKIAGLPKISDDIIGHALKWVVMHEVGHTLGLRHNFKASSWLPLTEVRKKRDAGEAFVSSVMDYVPLAFFADDDLGKIKTFSSDAIGPYDFWAVQYGYGIPKEGEALPKMLKDITAQSSQREHAYATDEDTMGLVSTDPLTNRYDLSDDPMTWAKSQIALTDKLLATFTDWAAKPDDPNHYLRQTFLQLMSERSRNLTYVSRLVGGQYFTRSRRGDTGAPAPLTFVPVRQQREALKLIADTVLSTAFHRTNADLLNRLTPSRWWDGDDGFPTARVDFPYSRFVQSQYEITLMALASPQTLQRVYDAEAKTTGDDKMTAAELIRTVRDTVWSELDASKPATQSASDAAPMISSERRGMQNTHLQYLLATAESGSELGLSPDLKNQARFALRELSERIKKTTDGTAAIDFASRGHLVEAKSRIDRTLEKPLVDAGGGTRLIIMQSGQKPQE